MTDLKKKLKFKKISLNLDVNLASELILEDKKHLDNNPIPITKNEIINLLKEIEAVVGDTNSMERSYRPITN